MDILQSQKIHNIAIEFTNRCNIRCVYCASVQPDYQYYDLDLTNFDQIVSALKGLSPKYVLANGHGETTMIKDWDVYCDRLLDAGLNLHIVTNLSKKYSEKEIKTLARFEQIRISCDTANSTLHSEIRKNSSLEAILSNMHNIFKEGGRGFHWNCVVSNRNVMSLLEYAKFGVDNGVKSFTFGNLVEYECGGVIKNVSKAEDPKGALIEINKTKKFLERKKNPYIFLDSITEGLKGNIGNTNGKFYTKVPQGHTRDCIDPWYFMMVSANGEVKPCCSHSKIGDLSIDNLKGIANNQNIKDIRERLLNGELDDECLSCRARGSIEIERLKEKVTHPTDDQLQLVG